MFENCHDYFKKSIAFDYLDHNIIKGSLLFQQCGFYMSDINGTLWW